MDRSTQRRVTFERNLATTNKQLSKHGVTLDVHRVPALDARCTSRESVQRQCVSTELSSDECSDRNTLAEICCTISHLRALQSCIAHFRTCPDADFWALICEDDVDLNPLHTYLSKFNDYVHDRPNDTGILQLACLSMKAQPNPYDSLHPYVRWTDDHFSTALYLVTERGLRDIHSRLFVGNVPRIPERKSQSDNILYRCTSSYTTNFPFVQFQTEESTIHNNHLNFHAKCVERIAVAWEEHDAYLSRLRELSRPFSSQPFHKSGSSRYLLFIAAGDNSVYMHTDSPGDDHRSVCQDCGARTWDTVISYYGTSNANYKKLCTHTPHVYRSQGTKIDQFYLFHHTHAQEIAQYAYVALFDDDIVLCRATDAAEHRIQSSDYKSLRAKDSDACLSVLFEACRRTNALAAQPACATHAGSERHNLSWWINTRAIADAPREQHHFTNCVETNVPIYRTDCLMRLMKLYRHGQIPSYGSDVFFMSMMGAPQSRCVVFDDIVYFNPSTEYKKIAVREIDQLMSETEERSKWTRFASKHGIPEHIQPKMYPYISKSRAFQQSGQSFLAGWDICEKPWMSFRRDNFAAIQWLLACRVGPLILNIAGNTIHAKKVSLDNIFNYVWERRAHSVLIL